MGVDCHCYMSWRAIEMKSHSVLYALGICVCFELYSLCDAQNSAKSISNEPESSTLDAVNGRPLSILLATGFWPGHLYPITALGEELVKRGHNVSLCATMMEGSDLLPALPRSYGINFISAGPDNLTQKNYSEAIRGLHSFSRKSMNVFTSAPSLTSSKVRAKVSEIISNYDILVSDMSVVPVGVYHAKIGVKSIIFTPIIPYVDATVSQWPAPLGGTAQVEDLSFLERLLNVFVPHSLMIKTAFKNTVNIDKEFDRVTSVDEYYDYPGTRIPLICNTLLGFDFPKTHLPLTHYVGVLLMQTTPPLDKSLEDWLSTKRDNTVIYIGTGATGFMSKDYIEAFVHGVLATKFDAVWTLSAEEQALLEDLDHDRFYVSKWISRQTLFKHRVMVLIFTHCGLNSVQEGLSNGLPVICTPHFFDHFEVGARIFSANVGFPLYGVMDLLLGRVKITAEVITSAIKSIAENKMYSEQAQKMQKMYSFAGGAKRAADLVEFYAEVGYDHLIPAYVKYEWSWVQYYNLDVYSLLFLLSFLLIYSVYKLIRCCCSLCCSNKLKKD